MCGIKIPRQDFALKMQGGAYARGGAYLRDTTVIIYYLFERQDDCCWLLFYL